MDDLLLHPPAMAFDRLVSRLDRAGAFGVSSARDLFAAMYEADRPLRILLIAEACGGGAGRHVLDLAEGLRDRGCEVHLISSPHRMDRFFQGRLERAGTIRHLSLPIHHGIHPGDLISLRSIRRYLREFGPFDVIHGHASKGGALARLAAIGSKAVVLYTLHGYIVMDPGIKRAKRRFYHAIEWTLSKLTHRIVTVSPEEQRAGLGSGLGRSRVIMIPNGVDPIDLPSRSETRRALGIAQDSIVAGFIGRLVDQKAPDVLIRAFAIASRSLPQARLAIVGSGPLEEVSRSLAEELGVGSKVHWLGERDGNTVLPAFDLLALSSRKEGLPYVVIEALAAGLPVVATRPAGVEILVEHRHNGMVVPPNQPEAFAAALVEVMSDPETLQRYGRASRRLATRFTAQEMVDRTLAAYLDSIQETERPDRESGRSSSPLHLSRTTSHPRTEIQRGVKTMAAKPRSSELHPGPGFRVRTEITRLDQDLMNEFRAFPTPDISDLLNRLYAVDPAIRCLTGDHHFLCGPALTVKVFPGDNLMVHKSLDVAQPGDIVIVDSGGSTSNAVLGDLVSAKAKHRGIAGFIVDGLIRDLPGIEELDFPVFARGTTPIGPLHRGPGEINYSICCGGKVVNPGDLIVADAAGIVVVPKEIAAELLERLKAHHDSNVAYFESVKRGEFSNQWVDRLLESQSCPILGADADSEQREPNGDGDRWLGTELAEALAEGTTGVMPQAQDLH
ncbi:glycosyltransferase [Singulisphaera sp. Ch08]|uniref:Glycosyltransferase n=1 Tax=Singulisphaera sp. Ch08 TaxID=3120278 RepID=A0AAU7C6X4_9BACT